MFLKKTKRADRALEPRNPPLPRTTEPSVREHSYVRVAGDVWLCPLLLTGVSPLSACKFPVADFTAPSRS